MLRIKKLSKEEMKKFLVPVLHMGFVSMYSYKNFWSKSYIYYNDLYVKGKVSSHHVFFTLWGGISTWKWLFGKDLTIIKSPQQNYGNNLYTIKDVICRWINIMVARLIFQRHIKNKWHKSKVKFSFMIDLVFNLEAYFGN